MLIEIKGVNFINKGAELMLRSIIDEFKKRDIDTDFCLNIKDISLAPSEMSNLKLYPWRYSKKLPFLGKSLNFIFDKTGIKTFSGREVVTRNQINVILDASGFVYSEQWGPESAEVMASYYREAKRKGQKVVLLPQAFGPFGQIRLKEAMQEIIHSADLIFARDKISYSSLKEITSNVDNIYLSKDFTIKMKGEVVKKKTDGKVCIIPNYRMIDMREDNVYLGFLDNVVNALNKLNHKFYFLIHESDKDSSIVKQLEEKRNANYEIIMEENPMKIKTLIGNSKFVIASRFHGIISALSQNIPTIATGWSHKYEMLYNEYEIEKLYLDNLTDEVEIFHLIELLSKKNEFASIKQKLLSKNEQIVNEVNEMWDQVFELIS